MIIVKCPKCGSGWGHVAIHTDFDFCNICKNQWSIDKPKIKTVVKPKVIEKIENKPIEEIKKSASILIDFVESDIIEDIDIKQVKPKTKAKAKNKAKAKGK